MPSLLPLKGIVASEIDGCRFGFYTAAQIRKISVKCLTSPISMDELGTPVRGGLYDPSLGPLDELESCETCGLKSKYCPGHMGHVELAYPVYHPLLFNLLFKLVRCMCFNCHRFLMSEVVVKRYRDAFVLLRQGNLLDALSKMTEEGKVAKEADEEEEEEVAKPAADASPHSHISYQQHCLFLDFFRKMNVKKCSHCHAHNPSLIKDSSTRLFQQGLSGKLMIANQAHGASVGPLEGSAVRDDDDDSEGEEGANEGGVKGEPRRYLPPLEMQERLERLFVAEEQIIKELFSAVNPDSEELRVADSSIFFLTALPVAPSKFRPTSKGMGDRESEHPQNVYYSRILNSNARLVGSLGEDETLTGPQLVRTILEMQRAVNFLIDSNKAPANAPNGIKQLLEKKQGLFRKHMMGKRVNFAARSVISPDPFLATNEIGVPDVFAKKLTFPEPVTTWNYKELSAMVANGPDVYPGANYIEYADGQVVAIQGGAKHADRRLAQSKTLLTESRSEGAMGSQTRVYRHVKNGDLVLMNRQPTLHKPSMMASKVHVQFGERVLRMHYANCKTFNADFDGDEMNMHYPQTYQAKAEAKNIMICDRQYVVPTNGGPLRGLIQDHVVSGVLLTRRGTFFEKEVFQQLIYAACCNVDSDMPIETPIPCILKPKPLWSGKQMVSVILKYLSNVYGNGLTLDMDGSNTVREKLWGEGSGEGTVIIRGSELLSGVLDKSQIGSASYGLVHSCYEIFGPTMAGELLSTLGRLLTTHLQSHGFTCGIDDLLLTTDCDEHRTSQLGQTKQKGKDVASKFVSLKKKDLRADALAGNNDHLRGALRARLQSDDDHASLDTVMQQALNAFTTEIIGSCLPHGFQKRFPDNFLSLMTMSGAKGSEVNQSHISCLLGQQVLEGRRVPVMPSGKALPCFEACDPSPRAGGYVGDRYLTGIRPQEFFFHCMAGREGLVDTTVKTSKSGYLQRCLIKHLEGLVVQYDYTVRDSDGSIVQFRYGEDGIDTCETKFLSRFPFLARNSESLLKTYNIEEMVSRNAFNPTGRVDDLMANLAREPEDAATKLALQELNPATNLGVVSDSFFQSLTAYFKEDPEGWFAHKSEMDEMFGKRLLSKDTFKTLMFLKFHQSLVQPGDAVGVIAGQSLGEPSTQMTLNTFHLAGHGETNVTLGIPRLTEVVMTASDNIKTPSMTLPLRQGLALDDAYDLAAELYKLCLPELLAGIEVQETLVESTAGQRYRNYEIVVDFHSSRVLAKGHRITTEQLQAVLGKQFVPTLLLAISKETKTRLRASVGEGMSSSAFDGIDDASGPAMPDYEETQKRKKELASYDDEAETAASKKASDEDEDDEDVAEDGGEAEEEESPTAYGSTINAELVQTLRSRFSMLQHLEFSRSRSSLRMGVRLPAYSKKLLMVNLVETVAENFVVQQVPKINKCFVGKKKNSEVCTVSTDGVNLVAAQRYAGVVDVDRIYCNDIHAVLATFGVEAARSCIIQEISKVFGVYDIKVDKRHLFLVADYMTFDGGYRAMNRVGMDAKASPWLQMSFETSVKFLCQAAQRGLSDNSLSPSARIVLGQPVKGGTGFFDVLQPLL